MLGRVVKVTVQDGVRVQYDCGRERQRRMECSVWL